MKHPGIGLTIGREGARIDDRPDLIKDEEVLAISLVEEPIRFIESQ